MYINSCQCQRPSVFNLPNMWILFIRFTNVAIFMAATPPVWWSDNLDKKTLSDDLGLAVSSVTRLKNISQRD